MKSIKFVLKGWDIRIRRWIWKKIGTPHSSPFQTWGWIWFRIEPGVVVMIMFVLLLIAIAIVGSSYP